ncbi:type II toxin-antitoxin system ParD family antitoxin [Nodularia sp. NIES-3585]|uniref:type II toxin-antitoxin system ParD family antitoxin n=1 Tax=Nodularia sp. NIES-3585 TaxID=1973477 RepID=UPI0020CC77C2|nr:type II toxin-antitoxin system ParD family antitoxin [Nodularia sp. NIES-3585]
MDLAIAYILQVPEPVRWAKPRRRRSPVINQECDRAIISPRQRRKTLITWKKQFNRTTKAMSSINISLPESMKAFVEEQVAQGDYGSVSEYLQDLITQDQKRKTQEHIEELLIAGLESGEAIEVNDQWWQQKRTNLMNRLHEEK